MAALLLYLLLLIIFIVGLALTLLGMPGLWLMVGGLWAYAWLTHIGRFVGWPILVIVLLLAGAAEVVEFLAGAAGSKAAGATKRGMAGAILGGIVGGIVGSFVIPIVVVGTIVGACVGSAIGAIGVELTIGTKVSQSLRIGAGAAKGRFFGILSKLAFGGVIFLLGAILALPISCGSGGKPRVAHVTLPTSLPTTTATATHVP